MRRGLKVILTVGVITCMILLAKKGILYLIPGANEKFITDIGIFLAGGLGALCGNKFLR